MVDNMIQARIFDYFVHDMLQPFSSTFCFEMLICSVTTNWRQVKQCYQIKQRKKTF